MKRFQVMRGVFHLVHGFNVYETGPYAEALSELLSGLQILDASPSSTDTWPT
jgi:hypothetical protein